MRRLALAIMLFMVGCSADEGCVDRIGSACVSNADCDVGDRCTEVPLRGFFCVAPDGSGIRIVEATFGAVSGNEGTARTATSSIVLRDGRVRAAPRATGTTADGAITLVDGEVR